MIQINLTPTNSDKVNLATLKSEIKGTIAVILDERGNLLGVNQQGKEVPVFLLPAPTPAAPSVLSGEMEASIITKVGDNINAGLSKMIEDLGKEIDGSQAKALIKAASDIEKEYNKELKKASTAFTGQLKALQKTHSKDRSDDSKSFHLHFKELQDEISKLKAKAKSKTK